MKFQQHNNCIECKFNNSPRPFFVTNELAVQLNGAKGIESLVENGGIPLNMMPRQSSQYHPYTPLDWDLMNRNAAIGRRHWRYNPSCIVGNTQYYGYGHDTLGGFQFYDWNPERKSGSPVSGRSVW